MNPVVEQTNFVQPAPLQRCTVYESESFMEVVASACIPSNLQQYRRIDKKHYVDTRTGELKEYQKQERPPDDLSFYSRSFNELRRIICYITFRSWNGHTIHSISTGTQFHLYHANLHSCNYSAANPAAG